MNRSSKVFEKEIYELWKKHNAFTQLATVNGDDIVIVEPGVQNNDISGPDFKNARIRIGNLIYVGDVEIDPTYNDWKAHGHNIDSKYSKVILHVALHNNNNQPYVYTKDGRKVQSVILSDFLAKDIREILPVEEEEDENSIHHLKCNGAASSVSKEDKLKFISKLGVERFKKKSTRIYGRLKELKYLKEMNLKEPVILYDLTAAFQERVFAYEDFRDKDLWEQLFYEFIFEALGYSKNKGIMLNLAQHVNVAFLKSVDSGSGSFVENVESALLNVGGLIPGSLNTNDNRTAEYMKFVKENWERIKPGYDNKYFDETQWHFFRIRPQNFPTIRIAGGARLLRKLLKENMIPVLIKKIEEIHNLNVLIGSLRSIFVVKSEGYWRHHYVFDQQASNEVKYFIGSTRADEILINVVLPFFSVYFEIFGKKDLSRKVFSLYDKFNQVSENKIINEIAGNLDIMDSIHSTIYSQGMTELFRNFCSKNKCLECEIGKVVFN